MKSLVMVGAGIQEAPAIKKLQKEGYTLIITDRDPNSIGAKLADFFICASATEVKKISTWILKQKDILNIKGIFTLINYAYETSVIAKTCGLKCLEPAIVLNCDDKFFMKKKLEENKIPTARFLKIDNFEQLRKRLNEIGVPAILKATDSFGGRGVENITHHTQVDEKWKKVSKVVSTGSIILEEKLKGEFIDLQGFIYKNKFYRAGDCNAWFTHYLPEVGEINPIETLNVAPAEQSSNIINKAYLLLEKAASVMGITWGPIGGDFILTKDGLKIIEISPRLHGPNGTLWLYPQIGIEPLLFLAQVVCDENPNEELLKPKKEKVALCKVFTGKPGITQKLRIPEQTNIVGYNYYAKINEPHNIKGPYVGVAAVFISSDNVSHAKLALKSIEKKFVYRSSSFRK